MPRIFYNIERCINNTFSIDTNDAWAHRPEKVFLGGSDVGASALIPTEHGDARDTEIIFHYGVHDGCQFDQFAHRAPFYGIVIVTEDSGYSADKMTNQLVLEAKIRPRWCGQGYFTGIKAESDLIESIKGILGFKIDVLL
jgi:hypothetical protein